MTIKTARRYYLGKRQQSLERDLDIEAQWHAKQDGEPGAALPATFPFLVQLATGGYTKVEDLDGADNTELRNFAGLTLREADAVLAALAPLL